MKSPIQYAGPVRRRCRDRSCPPAAAAVPDSVQRALAAPGRPLDASVQANLGHEFNADFTDVRLSDDAAAAASAQEVGARAYTHGNHIVVGQGFTPNSADGLRLLRHELTHVLQQRASGGPAPAVQRLGDVRDPAETEAEHAETGPADAATIRAHGSGTALRRSPVRADLLTAGDEQTTHPMRGNEAHRLITQSFMTDVAPFTRLRIPSGTRQPFEDTEGCSSDSEPSIISPLIYNDNPRSQAGDGIPDLAFEQPGRIELAEIKPAGWSCATFGEEQVANYVSKGNGTVGVSPPAISGTRFAIMPPGRWLQLPRHQRVSDVNLTYDWVGNGVIGYLATPSDSKDTLICALDDAGRVDAFIQNSMAAAIEVLDSTVNVELNRRLSALIDRLSLQELLTTVLGRGAASSVLAGLDEQLRRQVELQLRAALHTAKERVLRQVTERLRARMREVLAELAAAACAAGLVLTANELRRRLRDRLKLLAEEEALVVAAQMLREVMREVALVAAAAVVLVMATVLIALLVLDDSTGIGLADDPLIAPLGAAAAWAGRVLAAAAEWMILLLRSGFVGAP
jgi:hypothetical protein